MKTFPDRWFQRQGFRDASQALRLMENSLTPLKMIWYEVPLWRKAAKVLVRKLVRQAHDTDLAPKI